MRKTSKKVLEILPEKDEKMSIEPKEPEVQKARCAICNEMVPINTILLYDDYPFCQECAKKKLKQCSECGELCYEKHTFQDSKGKQVCEKCYRKGKFLCEGCGEWHSEKVKVIAPNNRVFCSRCFEKTYFKCDKCNEIFRRDSRNRREVNGKYWCQDCFNQEFFTCNGCNGAFPLGTEYQYRGRIYCIVCGEKIELQEAQETIKRHSYKPNPRFYGSHGPHYGIELEVAHYDDEHDPSEERVYKTAQKFWEGPNDFFYLKKDSSIQQCGHFGFEIVTQPLSWEWINSPDGQKCLQRIFDLKKRNFKSFETNSCGMHIHIGKNDCKDFHLFKVLKFLYKHPGFVLAISQREKPQFDRWSQMKMNEGFNTCGCGTMAMIAKTQHYCVRGAVNLGHPRTIEFRMFRGTLDHRDFMKNIEFIQSILHFAKENGIPDLTLGNYYSFLCWNRKIYPNLCSFMRELQEKVRTRKISASYLSQDGISILSRKNDKLEYQFVILSREDKIAEAKRIADEKAEKEKIKAEQERLTALAKELSINSEDKKHKLDSLKEHILSKKKNYSSYTSFYSTYYTNDYDESTNL